MFLPWEIMLFVGNLKKQMTIANFTMDWVGVLIEIDKIKGNHIKNSVFTKVLIMFNLKF